MLRAMRIIGINHHMLLVANSLLRSIVPLLNVCFIILITWIIFGIIGVSILGERMSRCNVEEYYGINKEQCLALGNEWVRVNWNYDNVIEAMISLFVLSSMENWPTLVGDAIDSSNSPEEGPVYNNRPWLWSYYILFIFISRFSVIRLYVSNRSVFRSHFLSIRQGARYRQQSLSTKLHAGADELDNDAKAT